VLAEESELFSQYLDKDFGVIKSVHCQVVIILKDPHSSRWTLIQA
jgi:hypothetical protein